MKYNKKRFTSKKEMIITLVMVIILSPFVYIFRGVNSGCETISNNIKYFRKEFHKEFGIRVSLAMIFIIGWVIIGMIITSLFWVIVSTLILVLG